MKHQGTIRLYKVLGQKGECIHGGGGSWHLPRGKRPGAWMPPIRDIEPCVRGYHLLRLCDILEWDRADAAVWEVEARGQIITHENKLVVSQARLLRCCEWADMHRRLYAADCAEHVLPLFERIYPEDGRPRMAIAAARQYARREMAKSAAAAAARAAARDDEKEWQCLRLREYLRERTRK